MNDREFSEWINHHCICFPAMRRWLDEMSREELPDGRDQRRATLDLWAKLLRPLPLDAAKAASEAMMLNPPRGFGGHPAVILKQYQTRQEPRRDPQPEIRDGQPVYRCAACRDTGTVPVFESRPDVIRNDADLWVARFTERPRIATTWGWITEQCGPPDHWDRWKWTLLAIGMQTLGARCLCRVTGRGSVAVIPSRYSDQYLQAVESHARRIGLRPNQPVGMPAFADSDDL